MAAFLQQALHQVQNQVQNHAQVLNQVSGLQQPTPQLAPFPHTLGVLPAYYANAAETIVLREKVFSLSGDSFTVATVDGRPVMQVKGEVLSLSGRKHVTDTAGQPLFDLRKEHLALHATFVAEDSNGGGNLFQVKSKFKLGGSKQVCEFTNKANGQTMELCMVGGFLNRGAQITESSSGQVVAEIHRKHFTAGEIFAHQQTYNVTIAPNVDIALIAAMCICLDEKRNEKS